MSQSCWHIFEPSSLVVCPNDGSIYRHIKALVIMRKKLHQHDFAMQVFSRSWSQWQEGFQSFGNDMMMVHGYSRVYPLGRKSLFCVQSLSLPCLNNCENLCLDLGNRLAWCLGSPCLSTSGEKFSTPCWKVGFINFRVQGSSFYRYSDHYVLMSQTWSHFYNLHSGTFVRNTKVKLCSVFIGKCATAQL